MGSGVSCWTASAPTNDFHFSDAVYDRNLAALPRLTTKCRKSFSIRRIIF